MLRGLNIHLIRELLTNILKYAFPDGREGKISIALKSVGERRARLTVRDNGIGFDRRTGYRGIVGAWLKSGGSDNAIP